MSHLPDHGMPLVLPDTSRTVNVRRWRSGVDEQVQDDVAEETPVALFYNGIPHVVMLATPADLEDLGLGFTLTEALASADEIRGIEVLPVPDACEVRIGIAPARFSELLRRQRNLSGRTGCGLCGTETVEQAIRKPPAVRNDMTVAVAELHSALERMRSLQRLNARTGSVHAAAWAMPGQSLEVVREDVGRHNALDKVLGHLVRTQRDPAAGYLLISSRASYEMVQKAATLGVGVLTAISAPTALAIRLANECNVTLVGFARPGQHVVYTHPERLQ